MIQEEKLKQQAILANWRIFGLLDSKLSSKVGG